MYTPDVGIIAPHGEVTFMFCVTIQVWWLMSSVDKLNEVIITYGLHYL